MLQEKPRKNILPAVLAAVAAVVLLSSCIFPTSSTSVKGYVRYGGKPVAGAEVSFGGAGGAVVTQTDEKGFYSAGGAPPPDANALFDGQKRRAFDAQRKLSGICRAGRR